MAQALLVLTGIDKSFGKVVVAERLSLEVVPGEALGIVGPNGAGKTTLFAMVAGDIKPDSGSVVFAGRDVTGEPAQRRCRAGMGRTYQVPRPFEHMTVFENVLLSAHQGAARSGRDAWEFASAALDTTRLDALANRRAGLLTLLQRKRLELARALATDPAILLLDEVAGGLTEPEVAELVETIRKIHTGGMTVVWIEHVVQALTATVDRLICLAGGSIIADGTPEGVLADPDVRRVYLGRGPEELDGEEL